MLKNKFRYILMILILASIVSVFMGRNKSLGDAVKSKVETLINSHSLFPARPVWWSDGKILAVGILPDSSTGDAAAQTACDLLIAEQLPVSGLRIEVYDVLKIQNEDEWSLLGFAVCE